MRRCIQHYSLAISLPQKLNIQICNIFHWLSFCYNVYSWKSSSISILDEMIESTPKWAKENDRRNNVLVLDEIV